MVLKSAVKEDSGSITTSSSKACREKQRRDHFDKATILTDAIRTVKLLREETSSLTSQNGELKQKISELKAEKNVLGDEKYVLVSEKEEIEQKIRVPTSYAVTYQAIGGKLMPFVNYSNVPLRQFVSQGIIDTTHDHVLRPPVA
ncbi:Transcription factor ILR3 [Bienertia sinuspersici]